jgi:hypothetical protein
MQHCLVSRFTLAENIDLPTENGGVPPNISVQLGQTHKMSATQKKNGHFMVKHISGPKDFR